MDSLTLPHLTQIEGELHLPGSKSISNRALLLAALGQGQIELQNLLNSNDVNHMAAALKTLGYSCQRDLEKRNFKLQGAGGSLPSGDFDLYLENAGTAVRSMTAACAASNGNFRIDGNERMCERPIADLVDALKQLGCDISYEATPGCPPLIIKGQQLSGGKCTVKGNISSQYLTALLIAAPLASAPVTIEVDGELTSKPYITMTIDMMRQFGVEVTNNDFHSFTIQAPGGYQNPESYFIEGDASSASYFLGSAAINGRIRVYGYNKESLQGESGFADVMGLMGAKVTWGNNWVEVESTGQLNGIDIDMNTMTDTGMTLAVVAMYAKGRTVIRNIYNWRVKETERLKAVATELQKAGATIEEGHDYLIIDPPEQIKAATIETYDDHRMAMAFSLLSFGCEGTKILDPGCTRKTFPDYFDVFRSHCK